MNVGLIGCGAIGTLLCELIAKHVPDVQIRAVYQRTERLVTARQALVPGVALVDRIDRILAEDIDLVVECAGHGALREFGPSVLASGRDMLIASVGAMADQSLESQLTSAATEGNARLRIPSGALGGLDALGAAKMAGLSEVRYEAHKSPEAWRGTHAETLVTLDAIEKLTVVYEGNARDAARLFPQNANVAAAIALAGVGFDRTKVVLHADPAAIGNTHRIKADGVFGNLDVSVTGKTLPSNPKTSMLAPYSLVRAIANLEWTLVVA